MPRGKKCEIDYENELKECSKCGEMLSFSEFYKNKNGINGLNSCCKKCDSISTGHSPRKKMLIDYENELKQCRSCEEILPFSSFSKESKIKSGLNAHCKLCNKKHREENIDHYREIGKKSEDKHRGKRRAKNKKYREENRYELNEKRKIRASENINYKLTKILRTRLSNAIKGNYKVGSAISDLGCSINFLKEYLASKFYDHPETGEQMSWDNHGFYGWHIDHIKPLASFDLSDRDQVKESCNYTNLQPLWAEDNHKKGDRT